MKKSLLLLCCALALPVIAQANVSIDLNVPGVSLHLGDQDQRGYYWDGYDWRPPQWWRAHQGHHYGERNERGMYWHGNRWDSKPPQRGHSEPHNQGRPKGATIMITVIITVIRVATTVAVTMAIRVVTTAIRGTGSRSLRMVSRGVNHP